MRYGQKIVRLINGKSHFTFFLRFNWNRRLDSFVVFLVWDDITNTAISKVLNFDPL
jgi:hypothetical protein